MEQERTGNEASYLCEKTKEMAREILYGWYTKTLSAEELLACSGGSFTMIGANLDEYFLSVHGELIWRTYSAGRTGCLHL